MMRSIKSNLAKKQQSTPQTMTSILTLNDDSDYVRAMDYSQHKNLLYSASDNGVVRLWDINLGKIISVLNPQDGYSSEVGFINITLIKNNFKHL
jgi:WD40 repeat protein